MTVAAIQPSRKPLEEARSRTAAHLALARLLVVEPRDLDDPALAFIGKVAVKGIIRTPEGRENTVQRCDFRCDYRINIVIT